MGGSCFGERGPGREVRARGRQARVAGCRGNVGAGCVAPRAQVKRLPEEDAAADALHRAREK